MAKPLDEKEVPDFFHRDVVVRLVKELEAMRLVHQKVIVLLAEMDHTGIAPYQDVEVLRKLAWVASEEKAKTQQMRSIITGSMR